MKRTCDRESIRGHYESIVKENAAITCIFLDIGGVLLTNGWDHLARRRAAKQFKLKWAEMEDRHNLNFATYEEGKLTLEEYLGRVVFYQKRAFTRAQFRSFMFAQSKPYPEMIEMFAQLKIRYGLKIAVVSNEARELNAYRIRKFKLNELVDSFISSCFVHIRKPDADIFRLALDIAQAPARQVCLYRKHADVRPNRGRFGNSKHSSHRLQIHLREIGVVRIAE